MNARLLRRLEDVDLKELRSEEERRYGTTLKLRSSDLLHRIIVWRVQAKAGGAFHLAMRKHLFGGMAVPEVKLSEGTTISRDLKEIPREVRLAGNRLIDRGELWKSLAKGARTITGTRWYSRRFIRL